MLQKCVRHRAGVKPRVSLTRTYSSISIGCTMHVGLRLRPDFCRREGGGIATLFPVGFPNVSRRDPDLVGQGSCCHFPAVVFVCGSGPLCLIFSWRWSPMLTLCQVPLRDGRSEIRVGGCFYAFWLPSGLPPFFPCCTSVSFPGFEIEPTAWVRSVLFNEALY